MELTAKKGLRVIVKDSYRLATITDVFTRLIMYECDNESGLGVCGGACKASNLRGTNGEIIKHPIK